MLTITAVIIRSGIPTAGEMNNQIGSPRAAINQTIQLAARKKRGRRLQNQLARASSSMSVELLGSFDFSSN